MMVKLKGEVTKRYFYLEYFFFFKGSIMPYCPECGGEMLYISRTRHYVCRSCGLSLTYQEIVELREKSHEYFERSEDERERIRKEYLRWWLSRKK